MRPEEFYAHARKAADAEGRLPLSRMTGWDVFPFEQQGLRTVPLLPSALPEPARAGEGGRDCPACAPASEPIWTDEHWRLTVYGPAGAPLIGQRDQDAAIVAAALSQSYGGRPHAVS